MKELEILELFENSDYSRLNFMPKTLKSSIAKKLDGLKLNSLYASNYSKADRFKITAEFKGSSRVAIFHLFEDSSVADISFCEKGGIIDHIFSVNPLTLKEINRMTKEERLILDRFGGFELRGGLLFYVSRSMMGFDLTESETYLREFK